MPSSRGVFSIRSLAGVALLAAAAYIGFLVLLCFVAGPDEGLATTGGCDWRVPLLSGGIPIVAAVALMIKARTSRTALFVVFALSIGSVVLAEVLA